MWRGKCKLVIVAILMNPYDSCLVKQSVASGIINIDRYESYLRILSDVFGNKNYFKILNSVVSKEKTPIDKN